MVCFQRILRQDTKNLFIHPSWLFMGFAFPFSLTVVPGLLTEGMYGGDFSSYDYYGITMMIFSVLNTATFSANCFLEERVKKANMRVVHSPIPSFCIPLTKITATFIFTSLCYTVIGGILHYFFGVSYGVRTVFFKVWLLFLVFNFFCSCLGVFVSCIFKDEGIANQLISLISTLIAITSGLFFPISNISRSLEKITEKLPLTRVTNTIFQLIYDEYAYLYGKNLFILIGLSVIIVVFCGYLFKGEDYL